MLEKLKAAFLDVARSRKFASLIHLLGWQDMRHRYRRSLLGPFWLVASTAALITAIALLFGPMSSIPVSQYVPYVAAGMIVWNLIVSMFTESCQAFISEATMIRQTSAPLFTYVARVAWRNTLFFAHNIVIYPVALWLTGGHTNMNAFLAVPGFLLVMINLCWIGLVLGILAARYRDLPKTIDSVIPVMMFLTPIWWMPARRWRHRKNFHLESVLLAYRSRPPSIDGRHSARESMDRCGSGGTHRVGDRLNHLRALA